MHADNEIRAIDANNEAAAHPKKDIQVYAKRRKLNRRMHIVVESLVQPILSMFRNVEIFYLFGALSVVLTRRIKML